MAEERVDAHYGIGTIKDRVHAALRAARLDLDRLEVQQLAPLDEFHIRGRTATDELARLVGLSEGARVLDVGSGIGGPARHLADAYGVTVAGVDLTDEYCDVARDLVARCGLADRVEIHCADALDLPFGDATFDVAWTQHVAMNISDKPRLYAEMRRVLVPGGRLALHDVVEVGGDLHFPVPWAGGPQISFLAHRDELAALVEDAGFRVTEHHDTTEESIAWFRERFAAPAPGAAAPPALGLHVIMGPQAPERLRNVLRNLEEGRIATAVIVADAI